MIVRNEHIADARHSLILKHSRNSKRSMDSQSTVSAEPSVEYSVKISKSLASRPLPFAQSQRSDLEFLPPSAPHQDVAKVHLPEPGMQSDSSAQEGDDDKFDLDPGGDTRPLVQIIQARIDEVTPLVHHTSGGCRFEEGVVRMRFRISPHGYTEVKRVVNSSGPSCLEEVAEKVLHMAEPYPYVAGWVPVTVKFVL